MDCSSLLGCLSELLAHSAILGNLQSLVTTLAVFVGGVWAVWKFRLFRGGWPRAELEHTKRSELLGGGKQLVTVTVAIRNVGSSLLKVRELDTWIQRVTPLLPGELAKRLQENPPDKADAKPGVAWYRLGRRTPKYDRGKFEIEPGETDRVSFDFIIDADVQTARVFTHIPNERRWLERLLRRRKRVGWKLGTMMDLSNAVSDRPSLNAGTKLVPDHTKNQIGEASDMVESRPLPEPIERPQPPPPPERRQGLPEAVPEPAPSFPTPQGIPEEPPPPPPESESGSGDS